MSTGRETRPIPAERLSVLPNPAGGFYVVEDTGDDCGIPGANLIPRGWTYPTAEEAEAALPFVARGDWFPSEEDLLPAEDAA